MSTGKMARAPGRLFVAAMVAVSATCVFAAAHVRLVNEGDAGPLYECRAAACAPARVDDPSLENTGWMDFYVLPEGCVELSGAVLRPSGPGIDVTCGPAGGTTIYRCEAGACLPMASGAVGTTASPWAIPLPADCGGRIHELIVLRWRTIVPVAFIECDASSGPAGGM